MTRMTYTAHSLEETDQLGAVLGDVLPDSTTVALCGTLGAGKTRLVQALATACGVSREDVVSPTFVLCQEYQGHRKINHLDVYRLRDDDEFLALGPEEYFESNGLTLVEWADRVEGCLPPHFVRVDIEVTGETSRRFEVVWPDDSFPELTAALQQRLASADFS